MAAQYRTARRFKNPAALYRWARERSIFAQPEKALVFGAGFLDEAELLRQDGWSVDALETPESFEYRRDLYEEFSRRPSARVIADLEQARRKYRLICVTHVLEFIEDPYTRLQRLRSLAERLDRSGHLLLSLRGWSDVLAAKMARPQGDGIITGIGTFVRGFSIDEALELVDSAGLKVTDSPHGPMSKRPEQVRLVCQTI